MSSLPPDLDVGRDEALDKARWDRAMAWIAAKIRTHDAFQPSWEAAVNELRQFGLVRLNDAVQPVYDRLNAIAQIGVLFTAASSSNVAVGVGTKVFEVAEEDRARFAAAAYLAIQKAGDPTIAMWGPLSSYNRDTGLLTVLVEQVTGEGSADAWIISASVAPDALHAARTDNPHGVTAAQVGAPTLAEMATAIADAVAALKGNVSAGYDTLKKIEDKLAPVLAGANSAYDTFAEIYAYITSDESAAAAINTALANRLRVDAAQGLTVGQQSQGRSNLGLGDMATQSQSAYVPKSGGAFNGGLSATDVDVLSPGTGRVGLNGGDGASPGYVRFVTPDGVRRGYIGWQVATNELGIESENGWRWRFSEPPRVAARPMFVAIRSDGANTAGISASMKVPYVSTYFNSQGLYSTASSRFTAQKAGDFWFAASALVGSLSSDAVFDIVFRVNGVDYSPASYTSGNVGEFWRWLSITRLFQLSAGDYVEVWLRRWTGTCELSAGYAHFEGVYLG